MVITKEWTVAPASHSHFNQGLWVKNIQQKFKQHPPPNKNICYAGLSLITEGRMSSGSQWVPTNSGEPELCLLACLRSSFLQVYSWEASAKNPRKKSYSPPQETGKCSFDLQPNHVPTLAFFPRGSHCRL